MLRKLIKYDMRALSKVLILAQLPIVILTLLLRIVVIPEIRSNGPDLVTISGIAAYVLYLTVAATLTELYLAYYMYKNLFSDQGYLTLTLPVSPLKHLLSKEISGAAWIGINCTLTFISLVYLFMSPQVQTALSTPEGQEFLAEFYKTLGLKSIDPFITGCVVLMLIGAICGPLMLIGSLCFGQLFSNHRILWAVIGYTIFTIITGLFSSSYSFRAIYEGNGTLPFAYFNELLIYTIILSIVFTVLCFFLSLWVLRKKVNLH